MTYQGYKTQEELFAMVEKDFSFQSKPDGYELTNQGKEDMICRFIVEHMSSYKEPCIPMEGIRYLHSELSNLSPRGMVWLLPNLLRKAVLCKNRFDTITDTIIYDLELAYEGNAGAIQRYSLFTAPQLQCIESVLEFLAEQHGHSISYASQALQKLSGA